MPNKLSQFWKELKRRNVVRVITVYAGAAFVILELVDIIAEPLKLPSWLLPVVIVLLSLGFIIAVILSWIYDIRPESGVVKTEPADKIKADEIPKSSSGWKVASYISFVVIVGLILLNVIPRTGKKEILDKSIAVLPFTNLSTDEENTYFIDGVMESILDNLWKIEDLRVPGRTSMMQYRENPKPISVVAEEMGVTYVLEGSGQKIGNRLLLTVQLIIGNEDRHIWSKQYDQVIVKVEDLIDLQKEIAQLVAGEIEAIITPQEQERIEQIPTTSLKAYELYQMGRFHWDKWTLDGRNKSQAYYRQAIEIDPDYALAYASLADSYLNMQLVKDTAEELALKALELDENLSEAYTILGRIYHYDWEWEKAEDAFQKALSLSHNYTTEIYYSDYLNNISQKDKARMHVDKAIEFDPLSFTVRYLSAVLYFDQGQFEKALRELDVCEEIQKGHRWIYEYRNYCYWEMEEGEKWYENFKIYNKDSGLDFEIVDQIFNENGMKGVLEWILENIIFNLEEEEQIGRSYYTAMMLARLGRYEEALLWLEKAYQAHQTTDILTWNFFNPLYGHPRFQAILEGMGLAEYYTEPMAGGE